MRPEEYAIAKGWDFSNIEVTAVRGVCEEDVEALRSTDLTPEALLSWCREAVSDFFDQFNDNE